MAAVGGMLVPALIYAAFNAGGPGARGWGVPMATDIAFAIGVVTVLGRRVSPALRVLLLALAVIDDLGAILVIAIFYTGGIALPWLAVAGAGLAAVWLVRLSGTRRLLAYLGPGVVVWLGLYLAGIHPTLAGVLLGLSTPVVAWLGVDLIRWRKYETGPLWLTFDWNFGQAKHVKDRLQAWASEQQRVLCEIDDGVMLSLQLLAGREQHAVIDDLIAQLRTIGALLRGGPAPPA